MKSRHASTDVVRTVHTVRTACSEIADSGKVRIGNTSPSFPPARATSQSSRGFRRSLCASWPSILTTGSRMVG